MNTNIKKYSEHEYKIILGKLIEGTATQEEREIIRDLVGKGIAEVEAILDYN